MAKKVKEVKSVKPVDKLDEIISLFRKWANGDTSVARELSERDEEIANLIADMNDITCEVDEYVNKKPDINSDRYFKGW